MKRLFVVLCSVSIIFMLASCSNNNADSTSALNSSNSEASSAKTISDVSEEPVSAVEWPSNDALSSLPKLCDTVDFYLDDTMGAQQGSYQIQMKEFSYDELKEYVNKLKDEYNFDTWNTVGEFKLPDKLSENESAFCPLTNNSDLWGIIEYKSSVQSDGYALNMVFYDYNPYSGY